MAPGAARRPGLSDLPQLSNVLPGVPFYPGADSRRFWSEIAKYQALPAENTVKQQEELVLRVLDVARRLPAVTISRLQASRANSYPQSTSACQWSS